MRPDRMGPGLEAHNFINPELLGADIFRKLPERLHPEAAGMTHGINQDLLKKNEEVRRLEDAKVPAGEIARYKQHIFQWADEKRREVSKVHQSKTWKGRVVQGVGTTASAMMTRKGTREMPGKKGEERKTEGKSAATEDMGRKGSSELRGSRKAAVKKPSPQTQETVPATGEDDPGTKKGGYRYSAPGMSGGLLTD